MGWSAEQCNKLGKHVNTTNKYQCIHINQANMTVTYRFNEQMTSHLVPKVTSVDQLLWLAHKNVTTDFTITFFEILLPKLIINQNHYNWFYNWSVGFFQYTDHKINQNKSLHDRGTCISHTLLARYPLNLGYMHDSLAWLKT